METILSEIKPKDLSKENLLKIYDFIINNHCKHGFISYDRFKNYLTNPNNFFFDNKKKGKIVAWTRGKGKTELSIMYLLTLHYLGFNWKIMFNPSETKELKENLINRIRKFRNWPEGFKVIYNQRHNNQNLWVNLNDVPTNIESASIIIFLPQISKSEFEKLPKFDLRIVDEAQRRILSKDKEGKTQNNLMNTKLKNKVYLLGLSGSPYEFSDKDWDRDLISTLEDMSESLTKWLPQVKLVSTGEFSINKFKDYNSSLYLKDTSVKKIFVEKNINKIKDNLSIIMSDMVYELSEPNTNFKIVNKVLDYTKKSNKKIGWVNGLYSIQKKVVIRVPLKTSANLMGEIIQEIDKDNRLNVKISHSDNDPKLEIFNDFWEDDNSLILVVVDRGTLGFDNDKWTASIDFTFGLNVINIEQFLDRLRPKENIKKLYYKVCDDLTMEHTDRVMNFVLHLRLPWFYKNFNGRNYDFLPLLKELSTKIKRKQEPNPSPEPPVVPPNPTVPRMIPIDNNLFVNAFLQVKHKRKGTLEIFAEHTFGDWKNKIDKDVKMFSDEEIIKSTEGFKSLHSWSQSFPEYKKCAVHHRDSNFLDDKVLPIFENHYWTPEMCREWLWSNGYDRGYDDPKYVKYIKNGGEVPKGFRTFAYVAEGEVNTRFFNKRLQEQDSSISKIQKLLNEGFSSRMISKQIKIPFSTLNRIIEKNNLISPFTAEELKKKTHKLNNTKLGQPIKEVDLKHLQKHINKHKCETTREFKKSGYHISLQTIERRHPDFKWEDYKFKG